MIGPPNMKADRGEQVNAATAKALADPALKARYAELGATPWPTSPAEIKTFRDSEEVRLLPIMKAAGIKPERAGCARKTGLLQHPTDPVQQITLFEYGRETNS